MKRVILLAIIIILKATTIFGQCSSLFSYAAYYDSVTFINQSNIQNAHYFWNFGDGTGSNYQNPIHKFPETGNYFVTLFAKDTISNCSAYYDYWVNITKYSNDSCQTSITDSIFFNNNYYLKIIDNSTNCSGYNKNYDVGPAQNFPPNNWISLGNGWRHARFLSRVQYDTYDTINGYVVHREAYKTSPFLYTSSKNYGNCSANFEFKVVSEDSAGQRILFTAMNKTASYYEWEIIGFGSPIVTNNDTISKYYPYISSIFWLVGLKTIGASNCKDTLYQNILVQNKTKTISNVKELANEINYKLYPNPFSDKALLDFPSVKEKTTLNLYNTSGQIVKTITNITGGQAVIYRENLSSGLYYFVLQSENKIIAKGKLIAK